MVLAIGSNILAGNGSSDIDIKTVIETIYPIGSIYISVTESCPIQDLGIGSWEKVSSGKVLQGSDESHSVGTTIDAGLPNITGDLISRAFSNYEQGVIQAGYKAFNIVKKSTESSNNLAVEKTTIQDKSDIISFDASLSNSIYGNSTTVQPPAFVVNIWKRIE